MTCELLWNEHAMPFPPLLKCFNLSFPGTFHSRRLKFRRSIMSPTKLIINGFYCFCGVSTTYCMRFIEALQDLNSQILYEAIMLILHHYIHI
jgi:hypothetical protein